MTGKIWGGPNVGKYLVCIDIDNNKGMEEFLSAFTEIKSIQELSQHTLVVQHDDAKDERAHIYMIVEKPIPKICGISRSGIINNEINSELPAIEVKTDSSTLLAGPGSIHKNGFHYEIQGTNTIQILGDKKTFLLETALNNICLKYNQNYTRYSSLPNLQEMDKDDYIVIEGNNRHLNLLRKIDSWYSLSNKVLTFDELLARAMTWNNKHCRPPLDEYEVSDLVKQSMGWINTKNITPLSMRKDDCYKIPDNQKELPKIESISIDREKIFDKIPDKRFGEYILRIIQKAVKREDSLIRLIMYTSLSTFTSHPLNLGIVAPTSEGKTYAVSEVIKLFPKQNVWMIGNMSPKVLIRDKGVMVDQNNEPVIKRVSEIKSQIENEKDEITKNELREQLRVLYENSKVLINLSNMILVFLEPPHPDTWNILKPILSHDTLEIEHPYVYKTETKGLEVKHIVTRGWPACIFCS
ncbi:MAG TPA: hypothetical protein VLE21_03220, partial [Candidatus Nitrosocosmicus sp.]|nr:hypothetical protein [Candidatus Nitrosocosmicus sp.]